MGINRININYGGYGMRVIKIVFLNGFIDFWYFFGFIKDLLVELLVIYI